MSNKKFRPPVERSVPDTATSSAPLDLSIAGKSVGPLPDDDARAMLARAARCLGCFISQAHAALEKISPERLAAAVLELDRGPLFAISRSWPGRRTVVILAPSTAEEWQSGRLRRF